MLVDCGDYALNSMEIAKVDKSKITDLLITHTHRDHCRLDNIEELAKEVTGKLNIWCHESIAGYFSSLDNCNIHGLNTEKKQKAGDIEFTALLSNHRTEQKEEKTVHYIIEKENKKLFYGCDGAWFLTQTFYALMHQKFDLFVFDGTVGDYDGDFRISEHNSVPMIRCMIKSMEKKGFFPETCKIYISHMAPSLHAPHKEIVRNLEKDNIFVAYDGLVEII
jgi:L-ascorbate metabolism protein UlaG (beta-lactamase superfamily)